MELGKFFEYYGEVISVKIFENKQNSNLFQGFVNFENSQEAEEALKAEG